LLPNRWPLALTLYQFVSLAIPVSLSQISDWLPVHANEHHLIFFEAESGSSYNKVAAEQMRVLTIMASASPN